MTGDDVVKAIMGLIMVLMGGAITWLVASVLSCREKNLEFNARLNNAEVGVTAIRVSQLTAETVRKVMEDALEKRDKVHEARRPELEKLLNFEIDKSVRRAVEESIVRIVREVKAVDGVEK